MGMQKRCNEGSQFLPQSRHNRRVNSTETPGGSGIPAGWYDDPSGQGLRWWDGDAWTEHIHTAESAAAAAGTDADGEREGKPPRDLVKLRESIRGRGAKKVGMILGAVVVVIVVVALLLSGGSESGGNANSGGGAGAGNPAKAAGASSKKQLKKIEKQLKSKNLSKAKKKQLTAQKKKLEKGGKAATKKVAPGEEGN
jgi:hypothetical protein